MKLAEACGSTFELICSSILTPIARVAGAFAVTALLTSTTLDDFEPSPMFGDDEIVQLREWGTERICKLSHRPPPERAIESSVARTPRVADVEALPHGVVLIYERSQWRIQSLEGTTDLRQDGEPRQGFALTPGVEVGMGATTLIAESRRYIALREFCSRVLGWDANRTRTVDHALRAIRSAAALRTHLVLQGEEDLVPLAHALHRRVLGIGAPFVVCDSRRHDLPACARSPINRRSGMAAFALAAGGSLCMARRRESHDLPELLRSLRETDHRVQLIVCAGRRARDVLLRGVMPIEVPPIQARETELPRIVHGYAGDAMAALLAPVSSFSEDDHHWVMENARSLWEIEKATLRVVAINISPNISRAAKLLGLSEVSLMRWIDRRISPPPRRRPLRIDADGQTS